MISKRCSDTLEEDENALFKDDWIYASDCLFFSNQALAECKGYSGPGGPCYTGPGGGLYTGPGGGAYTGPGGGAYTGPGGGAYTGPGGGVYAGPGGGAYTGPGGGAYTGPGGGAYTDQVVGLILAEDPVIQVQVVAVMTNGTALLLTANRI